MPWPLVALATVALTLPVARAQQPDLWARPEPDRVAALTADAEVLAKVLEALHPGLYRYLTPARWTEVKARLDADLRRDPTLAGAFLAISQCVNELRCGHAHCNPLNQPKAIVAELLQPPRHVPFWFRWLGRRMVVVRDLTPGRQVARGTEVLSLDGVPVGEIQDRLMSIARADGANDGKRRDYLGVVGGRYEAFDIYLPLLFPRPRGPFALSVRAPDGRQSDIEIDAMTWAQRQAANAAAAAEVATASPSADGRADGDRGEEGWVWSWLGDDTALLRMPGWALFDTKWDWAAWLGRHLDELARRETKALVIDLRGNEGGLDCGDVIIARLIAAPLARPYGKPLVRYRRTPAEFGQQLDTWDDSFRDWGDAAVPAETPASVQQAGQTFFHLTRFDDERTGGLRPVTPRYEGRVFVLVDAACSSATFQFAATMQRQRLATLVGQTTGGNQRGINGGAFFFLRLPNSRIEVDVPLIATFVDAPDGGVEPDVRVEPTIADIAAGVDREMATVLATLRAGR